MSQKHKTRLSSHDMITMGQLEAALHQAGAGYARWELCAQYAIVGQLSLVGLAVLFGVQVNQLAAPTLLGVFLWACVAVGFHIARNRLWMSESWLLSALTVHAFEVPEDLMKHIRPGGSVRWGVARSWLARWKAAVSLPVAARESEPTAAPKDGQHPPQVRVPRTKLGDSLD
ncbi:hypothetical protein [Sinimarinibacterium sp. CAU 1509]|uniref:hypothetical protein n=1 Tax=Sinimarinibacterium sp. CAU 1509 TaxID=2562283 RepID=UPI001B7FA30C|nr:hypothetical protein [Sinimarinibacterium sp. CAU 1509]